MARRRANSRSSRFELVDSLHDAPVAAVLDLHGYQASEAGPALRAFLMSWQRRGRGLVVHVITGRGKHSANGPVLRGKVAGLLRGEFQSLVADWGADYNDAGYKVKLR